ncbi:hypothetical protein BDZ88DRAFT_482763, partial [Geranomyces variabilis]
FQWLPAEVHVAAHADRACFTYINNLDPATHGDTYDALAMVLAQLVPLFEHVLTDLQSPREPLIDWIPENHYRAPADASPDLIESALLHPGYCWEDLAVVFPTLPQYVPRAAPVASWPAVGLRGRQLQMIVQASTVRLTPALPHHPRGTWHVAGLAHESVVAVDVYCLAAENVSAPAVSLRAATHAPQHYQFEDAAVMAAFGVVDGDRTNQVLGEVVLTPGRCVAWPNIFQHCFASVKLADSARDGHSTLVVFTLIDPTSRVTSTLQVPPQQGARAAADADEHVALQTDERLDLARSLYMLVCSTQLALSSTPL